MSNQFKADSTSVGDNTTVVGGPMSHMGDPTYLSDTYPRKPSASGKGVHLAHHDMPPRTFLETNEYMDTERPFFVTVGKDGLISALQKLDVQLRNVSGQNQTTRSATHSTECCRFAVWENTPLVK